MNKEIAHFALETALKNGAQGARISYGESIEGTICTLNGEIENIRNASSRSISLSIFADGRFASFSTNRITKDELERFIPECVASCRLLEADPYRTLPDPSLYYKGDSKELDTEDSAFDEISFEQKLSKLRENFEEIPSDSRIISVTNDYDENKRYDYIIDSQGLQAEETHTFYTIANECTVKGEGDIRPQNGWAEGGTYFDKLASGSGLKGYQRSIGMLGARKIGSGKYNIVFENSVAAKAVSAIIGALSGASIKEKNSFLLDSLGKRIFPEFLNIADNPHIPQASGATFFDGEGVATKYLDIIKDGYVNTYFLNTYYANRLNMPRTVNAPNTIVFPTGSDLSLEQILGKTGKGILITGFNGGNSNPVTGDFSYGIEGYYFENGIKLYPIKEMNITGNFISLWAKNIFIGNDPIKFYKWQIPSLAFADIDISGL